MSYAYINELPAAGLASYLAKLQFVVLETCPYQQPTNRAYYSWHGVKLLSVV